MTMRKKDLNWLSTIRLLTDGSGMYPGMTCDTVPNAPAHRLSEAGYIERYVPHNPIHKERWTITATGRSALQPDQRKRRFS